MKELTPRERLFVEAYLITHDKAAAAIAAGYKKNSAKQQGYEVSKREHVQWAISGARVARTARTEVTQDWVIEQLVLNVERAMGAVAVLDDKGEITGVFEYKGAIANKSLELLGKHVGMWQADNQVQQAEFTPLEDRLRVLQREDDIEQAENVERLPGTSGIG